MRFSFYSLLVFSFFIGNSCTHKAHITKTELSHQSITSAKVDSVSYKIIQPYKEKLDKAMNEIVSFSDVQLTKDQPEGNLGDFVADCLLKKSKDYLGADSG